MDDMKVLALDWGTSSLRAFALAGDGTILAQRRAEAGIRAIDDGDFEGAFHQITGDWLPPATETETETGPLIIMGGMIGSRQGWMEAPYLPCPANPAALAAGAVRGRMQSGHHFRIAPGLSTLQNGRADVMRGEELQILGAFDDAPEGLPDTGRCLICLPGTHSKWVEVENGIIRDFRTWMTGELFELLCRHSILGTSIEHAVWSPEGFRDGLAAARESGTGGSDLLSRLFGLRAGHLLGTLPVEKSGAFLSGLLIGGEVASALRTFAAASPTTEAAPAAEAPATEAPAAEAPAAEVCIIGNPDLTDLYIQALESHAIGCRPLGEYTGARGLFRLAEDLRRRS